MRTTRATQLDGFTAGGEGNAILRLCELLRWYEKENQHMIKSTPHTFSFLYMIYSLLNDFNMSSNSYPSYLGGFKYMIQIFDYSQK